MLDEKIYQEASTEFGTTIGVAHVVGYKKEPKRLIKLYPIIWTLMILYVTQYIMMCM